MIITALSAKFLSAVRTLPLLAAHKDTRVGSVSGAPSQDVIRTRARTSPFQFPFRRKEVIHGSVRVFRRYPKVRVFYVSSPTLLYDEVGWYSYEQKGRRHDDADFDVVRGPFLSHYEARCVWLEPARPAQAANNSR